MNAALISLAIQEAPAAIAALKTLFAKHNPADVPPTDEQVIAAYRTAFSSSLAKDELWLASHPEDAPPAPPEPPAPPVTPVPATPPVVSVVGVVVPNPDKSGT